MHFDNVLTGKEAEPLATGLGRLEGLEHVDHPISRYSHPVVGDADLNDAVNVTSKLGFHNPAIKYRFHPPYLDGIISLTSMD